MFGEEEVDSIGTFASKLTESIFFFAFKLSQLSRETDHDVIFGNGDGIGAKEKGKHVR